MPAQQLGNGKIVISAAVIAAALVCRSAPIRAADDWKPSPVLQELYEKAKSEKEVHIWSSGPDPIAWINAAFSKRFPGIEVKPLPDQRVATKLIAESRAGNVTADVWAYSMGGTLEVQKRGLLSKVDWSRFGVQSSDIFFNGEAASYYSYVFALTYPVGKVNVEELPKTWKDLLDPKWKNKLVSSDFLLPRVMGYFAMEWGEAEAEKWGRRLIDDQNIIVTNAPNVNFLRSGERLLIVADSTHASTTYKQQGLDSAYKILDYAPASQFVLGLVKSAPHPNAAQLLIGWLVSDDGRKALEETVHAADIRPGSKSQLLQEINAVGSKPLYETPETVDQRANYYKKFSDMLRGK
jgi:iron(III) transport system substrate-binding protein